MKNISLPVLVIFSMIISQSSLATEHSRQHLSPVFSRPAFTDTLLAYLSSLDLNYYKGKPVDSFLAKLPAGSSAMAIMDLDGSRYATLLQVKYDSIQIRIYVKDFLHMNPRNYNRNWDINLFKLENISCIEIWNRRQRVSPECKWWE